MFQKTFRSFATGYNIQKRSAKEKTIAVAEGFKIKNATTKKFTDRFSAEIDGPDDQQAFAKLEATFNTLALGTEIELNDAYGNTHYTKTENGWEKSETYRPAAPMKAELL